MEQRVRQVEGDVRGLKAWKEVQVDPWIKETAALNKEMKTFMDTLRAETSVREKLDDERHSSNSFKLNLMITAATVGASIAAIVGLMLSLGVLRH